MLLCVYDILIIVMRYVALSKDIYGMYHAYTSYAYIHNLLSRPRRMSSQSHISGIMLFIVVT